MLDHLAAVEAALPALIADADGWRSLNIDYHPPKVERLYRDFGSVRVNLHRAWPCDPAEALIHPHPWPSAMRLVRGRYRMWIGYGAGLQTPPLAGMVELAAGSTYAMVDPDQWHSVVPLGAPTLSVMVTGSPWGRPAPVSPARALKPLAPAVVAEMLRLFAGAYSKV